MILKKPILACFKNCKLLYFSNKITDLLMKKNILVLCLSIFIITTLRAQDTIVIADCSYGGYELDVFEAIGEFSNGDFILAGETWNYGAGMNDVYLVKINHSGDTIWTKTYGGDYNDRATDLVVTGEDDVLIAGRTKSFGPGEWGNIFLFKMTQSGEVLWYKTYGGNGYEDAGNIIQTSDGGFILTGTSESYTNGGKDIFIVKTDADGNQMWTKNYGSTSDEIGVASAEVPGQGYVIAANRLDTETNNYAAYLLMVNHEGDTIWTKSPGNVMGNYVHDVLVTQNNNIVFAGQVQDSIGNEVKLNAWYFKMNPAGEILFNKTIGMWADEQFYCLTQGGNGDLFFAGQTESICVDYTTFEDLYLVRTDLDGNVKYEGFCDNIVFPRVANDILITQNNEIAIGGLYRISAGFLLMNEHMLSVPEKPYKEEMFLYPNPARDDIYVTIPHFSGTANISMYNTHGQLVKAMVLEENARKIRVSDLPSGMYLIKAQTDNNCYTSKLLIQN
jgi:hypothetical protein